ncbi:hypothetical protein X801_09499 [Opisthorchis viverrini]|uniref:Protein kinase domain-containing protein n=1 Tax=Opisthorchis viverrini TaxID=6198 RepID=A0A1S8WJU3_OPIVI|nr:hypothetical protein X801_09499 [Opisthorchis viverrini]
MDQDIRLELHSRVLSGKYRIPFYMTENCEAMLRKMLIINPKKRATLRRERERSGSVRSKADTFLAMLSGRPKRNIG